jgi:hypothetical protein
VGIKIEADQAILWHIQVVVSLIEGRQVVLQTINRMIGKLLRQHRIDLRKNLLYPCRVPP